MKAVSTAFRPSTPGDLPAIAELLQAAFEAPAGAPFLDPKLLHWKYFEPHPEWREPRSYVLDQGGKLIAHGCVWPSTLRSSLQATGPLQALCLIDWVSSKTAPGMGIMLARKLGALAPVMLSIGGSEMTQAIMPKIGFVKQGELLTYARVLRPWSQFRTRPGQRDRKAWLRFFRNLGWSLAGRTSSHLKAVAVPCDPFLAGCPGAKISAYDLFLFTHVGGQSRIAEVRTSVNLAEVYGAAIQVAEGNELVALAHNDEAAQALEANGFRLRGRRSVFVMDPGKRLAPSDFPLPLTMLHDDMFYLNTPEYPYFT